MKSVIFRSCIVASIIALLGFATAWRWFDYQAEKTQSVVAYWYEKYSKDFFNCRDLPNPSGKISDRSWNCDVGPNHDEYKKNFEEGVRERDSYKQFSELSLYLAGVFPAGLWGLWLILNWIVFGRISLKENA